MMLTQWVLDGFGVEVENKTGLYRLQHFQAFHLCTITAFWNHFVYQYVHDRM
jgi:hypothetical protein